jgi:molecular chaperone GrpE
MTKNESQNIDEKSKIKENTKDDSNLQKSEDDIKSNQDISLEEKIKELEDKLTRTLADMENQRRRYEKEKDDAFDYGGFSFAREALNLIDNLERSKESLKNDEKLKNTEALKKISEHLDIIYKDMLSIFKKNNIEPIKSINEKLDPNVHQAMMEIEDNNKEPGIIIQEIQKGFMMKDRLLRPALVGVSKKTDSNKNEDKKDEENQDKSTKNQ